MDHRGAQPGAVAAVFLVDVLDHLLAPLVLEIDIDIRGFIAIFGNEALEQQGVLDRVDRGDSQTKAHRRIGRRAAPLAQDRRLATAREINHFFDGQKVLCEVLFADQGKFLAQRFGHFLRHPVRIVPRRPLPGQPFEIALRIESVGIAFTRVFIAQFLKAEAARIRQFARRA